jgi:hypothetical protein
MGGCYGKGEIDRLSRIGRNTKLPGKKGKCNRPLYMRNIEERRFSGC